MAELIKVVRLPLIIEQTDKDGEEIDYKDVKKILWDLQYQTRQIKNKAIQLCWEYSNFSSDYYKLNSTYPKEKEILGYSRTHGFVYNQLKDSSSLNTSNLSTTLNIVCQEFKNSKLEMLKGDKSIINYKSNQPLDLHSGSIKLEFKENNFYFHLSLLNNKKAKELNFNAINFKAIVKDKSSKTILERCIDGIYKIAASKLIYDKKKGFWNINLSYKFENKKEYNLDENKILGVDLGIAMLICASVHGDKKRFSISGGEIEEFRKRIESRKKSLGKQTKYCGDGRIGHGRNTRCKPIYRIEDKIKDFRNTTNHKYTRELIKYAIRNNCGTIQMEDLKGISSDNKFLKNWTYYDMRMKIESKAKEAGIKVVYINPRYTSQRCSICGYIDKDNRQTQAEFICKNPDCSYLNASWNKDHKPFKENADYNASQNISIKDIDKIIAKKIAKIEKEEKKKEKSANLSKNAE